MKNSAHYLTMLLQNKIALYIIQKAQEYDLYPGQPKVLEFLRESDGCTPTDICKANGLDKSTITGILGRMKRNGLIYSEPDMADRRQRLIFLTDKGRKLADDFQKELDLLEEKLWGPADQEDRERFYRQVRCMIRNLETDAADQIDPREKVKE